MSDESRTARDLANDLAFGVAVVAAVVLVVCGFTGRWQFGSIAGSVMLVSFVVGAFTTPSPEAAPVAGAGEGTDHA